MTLSSGRVDTGEGDAGHKPEADSGSKRVDNEGEDEDNEPEPMYQQTSVKMAGNVSDGR